MKTVCALVILTTSMCSVAFSRIEPSGGYTENPIVIGDTLTIRWDDELIANKVEIVLWDADRGLATTIATKIPNTDRAYTWRIPNNLLPGEHYRFLIRDQDQERRFLISPSWVTVSTSRSYVGDRLQPSSPFNEILVDDIVRISPQPANTVCTVNWKRTGAVRVDIINMVTGNIVASKPADQTALTTDLNLEGLSPGTYCVHVAYVDGQAARQNLRVVR